MNKELDVLQALEMSIGTRFNIEDMSDCDSDYIEILEGTDESKILCWNGRRDSVVEICTSVAKMKLTPILKSVSFMEVLESGKRCMVKHKLIDEYDDGWEKDKLYMFNNLDWVLFCICNNNLDIHEIIKNGEWYIED